MSFVVTDYNDTAWKQQRWFIFCFLTYSSIFLCYVCVLGCGGTLYGDRGSFASPNYPGTYPNNTHCEWGILAPRGRVVTITFAQFSIDDHGDCQSNFLKLYDGPDTTSAPVGPYCGAVCSPAKQLWCSRCGEYSLVTFVILIGWVNPHSELADISVA